MQTQLRTIGLVLAACAGAMWGSLRGAEVPRLRRVGFCSTGFGVPGSGRPLVVGSQVLVNAGEGCPTVIDAADPRHPRVLRHIPSWFFTTGLYPVLPRDLTYLSSSRGRLLVLRGLSRMATEGRLEEIPWDASRWGRSFLSAIRPDGIAYTARTGEAIVLDLADPAHPKGLARVAVPRLRGTKGTVGAGLLTFSPDHTLAAATLDGGTRIGILRWLSPTKPELCGEFENAEVADRLGAAAYGRVVAIDATRLIIGHPASTSKYWQSRCLSVWDISDPRRPRRASQITFPDRRTHIRDVALAGRYAFLADGREISSGHTVPRTQHSRLLVLDLQTLVEREGAMAPDADRLDLDELRSPKLAAQWHDPMPTEYSRMTLHGTTLYLNDYNYGLRIFDVRDPLRPVKLGGAPVSAEGHWLYLHADHAYMAHTFGGTIHVINIADPAQPRTVGHYWDGQWLNYKAKLRGRDRALYIPQFDGLAIADLADPAHPKRTGEFRDGAGEPLFSPCIDLSARHAFVVSSPRGKTPPRLLVYDIASPLEPRLIATLELPGKVGLRVVHDRKRLFLVAYGGEALLAIDVADPTQPRITARLSAPEVRIGERTVSLEIPDGGGNGAPGIAVSGGYLYVVTGKSAPDAYVVIYDVRDPAVIRPAATLDVTDRKGWQYFVCDVVIDGSRLILGDYGREEVYDITSPLAPRRIAAYRRSYTWQAGTVRGDLLYVPKLDGLEILALPKQP